MSDQPTMTDEELGLTPEIEVEVPAGDGGATPETAREIPPEEGIEELRAKLKREEQARAELERQAAQATQAATYAFSEKEQADIALVQSALQQIEREAKQMKADYAAALKSGDAERCAEITFSMQEAANNRAQLEQGLQALNERAAANRERLRQPVQPTPRQVDPVEQLAANLSPKSAAWIRQHPEFATDPAKTKRMIAAHYEADAEGIAADTPEYFDFVEKKLGVQREEQVRETTRPAPRPAPPPAAPARSSGPAQRPTVVRLSPEQREAARASGLTEEEYAKNLLALRSEGKLSTAH